MYKVVPLLTSIYERHGSYLAQDTNFPGAFDNFVTSPSLSKQVPGY
jgi:hypothetical protein